MIDYKIQAMHKKVVLGDREILLFIRKLERDETNVDDTVDLLRP